MKHLIFFSLIAISTFKCTGARAEMGKVIIQPSRTCERIVQDLRKIAWDDPDSYDLENLEDQGTVKYMCDDATKQTEPLCRTAFINRCK